jgi:hypothetical protein
MSALLDKMGPEDLLEPWYQAVIMEKVKSKKLKLSEDGEEFLSALNRIQNHLSWLVELETQHKRRKYSAYRGL